MASGHPVASLDRFGSGPEYTVGVEEELMLLDEGTLELAALAPDVLREAADPPHVKAEIRKCMIEIASEPCISTPELYVELAARRREVLSAAATRGTRVAATGTHPFSRPEWQPVTDTDRYHHVMAEAGYPARWSVVFGTHVHVALASADKAIGVTEALLEDLPTLVALGASSPLWHGIDTGLASTRLALWATFPRSGIPPRFSSFSEYRACLASLHRSGAVPDASHVWWDLRSQERLGTLELRALDSQPDIRDTVALAGLVQSLVRFHGSRWDAGERAAPNRFLVTENRWMAVRQGLGARFVRGDGAVVGARAAVDDLLNRLADDAAALETGWALEHLSDLADSGGPAARERRLLARCGDPVDVVRALADLTGSGLGLDDADGTTPAAVRL